MNFLVSLIAAQDGEEILCPIKINSQPQSLKDMDEAMHTFADEWTHRKHNEGAGYVANEQGRR